MKEPTKNIITRDTVKKELLKSAKTEWITDVSLAAGVSLFLLPLALFFIIGGIKLGSGTPIAVVAPVGGVLCLAIPCFPLRSAYRSFCQKRLIENDLFEVSLHPVVYKGEEERRTRWNVYTSYFLYFSNIGKVTVTNSTHTMTKENDRFYLVVLLAKKPYVIKYYDEKMYTYREETQK